MKRGLLFLIVAGVALAYGFAEDIAVQVNEKTIILHDDFTWSYQNKVDDTSSAPVNIVKDASFDKTLISKTNKFKVSYDSTNWYQIRPKNAAEFALENGDKTGFAMVIFDGLEFPLKVMEKVILQNANNIDPDAHIIDTQDAVVNGTSGEFLTYTAKSNDMEFTFFTFLASKETGSIQYTFYTLNNVFEKLKPSFIQAMSGLEF